MKRRTDKKRSPAEIKADNSRHYGEMAGRAPSKEVEESFKRPRTKSKGICGMIAKQTEEMINVEDNNRV